MAEAKILEVVCRHQGVINNNGVMKAGSAGVVAVMVAAMSAKAGRFNARRPRGCALAELVGERRA